MDEKKLIHFFEESQREKPICFLYDNIYDALSQMIILEYCAPGSSLSDGEISEILNVSRTPVRRAFSMLMDAGLLEYVDGKKYHIPVPDQQSMLDIMVFRESLETAIAYSAAKNATDESLAELQRRLQHFKLIDCSTPLSRAQNEAAFHTEVAFHQQLCNMCTNPYLRKEYNSNIMAIYRSMFSNSSRRQRKSTGSIAADEAYQAHMQIFTAVKFRSGRMAMEAVFAHLYKAKY